MPITDRFTQSQDDITTSRFTTSRFTTPQLDESSSDFDLAFNQLTTIVMIFIIVYIIMFSLTIYAATYIKNNLFKILLIVASFVPGLNFIAFIIAILVLTGVIKA